MSNPDSSTCSGLRLESECKPDPVSNPGAKHSTSLANNSTARYTVTLEVHVLYGRVPGASLAFYDGANQVDIVRWFAGTFGQGRFGKWDQTVQRLPAGTAQAHSIRTTAEFGSDVENDPQDDDLSVSYKFDCTVDVSVI